MPWCVPDRIPNHRSQHQQTPAQTSKATIMLCSLMHRVCLCVRESKSSHEYSLVCGCLCVGNWARVCVTLVCVTLVYDWRHGRLGLALWACPFVLALASVSDDHIIPCYILIVIAHLFHRGCFTPLSRVACHHLPWPLLHVRLYLQPGRYHCSASILPLIA